MDCQLKQAALPLNRDGQAMLMRTLAKQRFGVVAIPAENLISHREPIATKPRIETTPGNGCTKEVSSVRIAAVVDVVESKKRLLPFPAASARASIVVENFIPDFVAIFSAVNRNSVWVSFLPQIDSPLMLGLGTRSFFKVSTHVLLVALAAFGTRAKSRVGNICTTTWAQALRYPFLPPRPMPSISAHGLSIMAPSRRRQPRTGRSFLHLLKEAASTPRIS